MASGSWLVIEEMLERGDPAFVEELRACEDAARLANFAASWFADRRPQARRFLLQYLLHPLNAYHHEGLVKRLFKLAEAARDDEVMAHFLVLLDRSIRRRRRKTTRFLNDTFSDRRAAEAQVRAWQADGAENAGVSGWSNTFYAWASWPVERLVVPRVTMPRGGSVQGRNPRTGGRTTYSDLMSRLKLRGKPPRTLQDLPEAARKKLETFRLFTAHTRHYLRRRTWRYFRKLADTAPERYVPAVLTALKLYEDADMPDGLALLDNWGLIHILFHSSPVLWARSHGWTVHPGHGLSEVTPAPAFPEFWRRAPAAILDLLREAKCRAVRRWALFYLRQDPSIVGGASVDFLLDLLQSSEPEIIALAARALENRPGLEAIPVSRWLELVGRAPAA